MTETIEPVSVVGSPAVGIFVGREQELATLVELLDSPEVRLVCVTGTVGVGKSRLVAEVIRLRPAVAPRHVIHVSLASVRNDGLALDAVIRACGGAPGIDTTAAQALWRTADGASVLLVLDGGDEVAGLSDVVHDLLDSYPALDVLLTRVRPLGLDVEHVLALTPFPAPASADDGPAVALFAAKAVAADHGCVLDVPSRAAVAEVCRLVGGLPRAIDVVAARVESVPPVQMAAELAVAHGAHHPQAGGDAPEAHLSLDAVLEWSIGLLAPPAATLFDQLSVFEGAFTLGAAHRVTAPARPERELLGILSELVDCHLLDVEEDPEGAVRFRTYPPTRALALRRLVASGGHERVRDAHAEYWAARCRVDPMTAERHFPDVLAALDRRWANGWYDEALLLTVATSPGVASSPGAEASLLPLMESVLGAGSVSDEAVVARTLMWATTHTPASGAGMADYGAWTSQRLRRSIELARASGDDVALLEALELGVTTLGVTFDLQGAITCAHEGHAVAGRLGDERATARFDMWVAMAHGVSGDISSMARSTRSAYERGLRIGEDAAVVHAAVSLHGLPDVEQGPIPLLDLDELLLRAEARGRPTLVLLVLSATVLRGLAHDSDDATLPALGRMLLVAEGLERTLPMASAAALMLSALVALRQGEIEDAVRLRQSLLGIEQLLPTIVPTIAPAYLAAVASLPDIVPEERYAALAAETTGLSLTQANRRAQVMIRGYQSVRQPTAPWPSTAIPASTPSLTPRELDVLRGLVGGGTNREIAEALGLAPKTVMHYTTAIYRKLGVRGRAGAVGWAVRSGTVTNS